MTSFLKTLFGKKEETAAADEPAQLDSAPEAQLVHVTDETFESVVLEADLPVLVDFWAPWCGPCRMIAPVVEDLSRAYAGRAVIAKVNTDESSGYASKLGIMGIPTLVLFNRGKEADRIVGFANRRSIEEKLNALLN